MNIKLLNSWLREYLKTEVRTNKLAEILSLASVSVEKIEPHGTDYVYDIEITTNRPDLMSVIGLAREGAAVLPQAGIDAKFTEPKFPKPNNNTKLDIEIVNDPKLVNRICAVALEIKPADSPSYIKERLEAAGINPHGNVIDITNYVMREIGHPMHAFDYDKIDTKKMIIREAAQGEKIVDLHGNEHILLGGDIVADNGKGEIIDLLGVIGTKNSAVSAETKKVLLFVDNNDPVRIRKTSMGLAVRTEAATLNEKGLDPEKAYDAILRGIELLEKIGDAKVISEIVDIYPNKPNVKILTILQNKINSIIGLDVSVKTSAKILEDLGFDVLVTDEKIKAVVPSWRINDVSIEEDLVEEIVRVYGYEKIPNRIPAFESGEPYNFASDRFYWEQRVKNALKYWGFTEIYTYSMVSEELLEVATSSAVTIKNPLSEDRVYMRTTLVPSLLEAVRENKNREELKLFELANVYLKNKNGLPDEKLKLAGVIKTPEASFFGAKGIVEAVLNDVDIKNYEFKKAKSGSGADVYIGKDYLGQIEQLEDNVIDFELEFEVILKNVSSQKIYSPASKYPEAIEDLRFEIDGAVPYEKIIQTIKGQSDLIKKIELLDVYKSKKTFRIIYQSDKKNLTAQDLEQAREKIIEALKKSFKAEPA